MTDQNPETVTFEAALDSLEEIVRRLEGGDVGLEEAVALFEEGQRHLAACRQRLTVAQGRIEELTASELPVPAEPAADALSGSDAE